MTTVEYPKRIIPGSPQWSELLAKIAAGAVGSLVFNSRLLPDPARQGALRLSGEKFYSTATLFADYLTVTATTDQDSVVNVVIPTHRDGVRLVDGWDGFGSAAPVPANAYF